jgi:hypothetical protein
MEPRMTDDSQTTDDSRITRRNVLRTAVASAAVAGGFAAPGAGRTPVAPERVDDAAALDAIDAHGGDLLDLLADRDLIEKPVAAALADGTATTEPSVGPADDARFEVETEQGRLGVTVDPAAGNQYAILAPDGDDSDEVTVIDPNSDVGEVEPRCPYISGCIDKADDCYSDGSCPEYYIACCDYGCYTDGTTGYYCYDCYDCEPSCEYHCG